MTLTTYQKTKLILEGALLWHNFMAERDAALRPDTEAWHAWLDAHCGPSESSPSDWRRNYDHPLAKAAMDLRESAYMSATFACKGV